MLSISLTPTSAVATALNLANKERNLLLPNGKKEPRKSKVEKKTPLTGAPIELIVENIKDKSLGSNFTYRYMGNPADMLIGLRAYTSGPRIHQTVPLQIAVFKAALKSHFPSLDPAIVDSIADEDFQIDALSCFYYFQCDDETDAYQRWLNLFNHLKVVLDCGHAIPSRKGVTQKYTPKVQSDSNNRSSFTVNLAFGQVNVSIGRDRLWPGTFDNIKPKEDRPEIIAKSRSLLCFEVHVDLQQFQYTDQDGLKSKLPKNYEHWTNSKLQDDPLHIIWEAIRWEFWLNVNLATDEAEINREGLSLKMEEILNAYLAGDYVLRHSHMPETAIEIKKCHDILIKKSGVNFLTPWVINKLNQCQAFSEFLAYENRFDPATDPAFCKHTLSKDTANQATKDFDARMRSKPNWTYNHAE